MARRTLTITDQDKAEMLRLYVAERKGLVELSKQYGISPSTVSRFLTVQGATMRPRGTRPNKEKETLVNPLESHAPEVVVHRTECFPKVNKEEVLTFSNEEEGLDFSLPTR